MYYIKDRRAADHQDKRAPDRQVWGEICFTSISAAPADRRPPPPLHTHTPRALVRTLHQGPTQNVTPSPKCRNKRGKLLGFSTLKTGPLEEGDLAARPPFKIRAVGPPGPHYIDASQLLL